MLKFVERMSLEEYMALPEQKPYVELLDGLLVEKCMGFYAQQTLVSEVLFRLGQFAHDRGLRTPLPYVSCADATREWVLVPAISWYSRERAPWKSRDAPYPLAALPEFMVEAMGEGEHTGWMLRRIAHCLANGVQVFWAVDADTRTVTVWQPDAPPMEISPPARLSAGPLLAEFELDLEALFGVLQD